MAHLHGLGLSEQGRYPWPGTIRHGLVDDVGRPQVPRRRGSEVASTGTVTLWLVDGAPVAMAGRTRVIDGMTRVGAVYAPSGDPRIEASVLAAATEAAAAAADHVLVLASTADRDGTARLAALGYRSVRERVLLAPSP